MKKDFNRLLFQPFVKLQLSLLLSEPQKSVSESNFYSNQLQSAEITLKTSDAAFYPSVGFIHQLLWASHVDERHFFYIVITRNIWKWRNILCRKLHSRMDYQFVCSFLRLSSAAQETFSVTSSGFWWKKFVFVCYELLHLITEQQRDDPIKSETSNTELKTDEITETLTRSRSVRHEEL